VLGIILTIIGLSTNFIAPKLLGWLLSGPNASVQVSIYYWPADHPTCWSYLIDIGSAGEFHEIVDQIYLKAIFPGSLANFTFGGAQETSSDKGTEGLFYRHLKPGEERSLLEVDKDGECHAKTLEFTDVPYFKVVPKGVH
jgi:hypothetical protein